jgi:hypothetical protein
MIGVTRNGDAFVRGSKKRQIVQAKGSTLVIRNKVALKAMATNN